MGRGGGDREGGRSSPMYTHKNKCINNKKNDFIKTLAFSSLDLKSLVKRNF
jgi:hypothetical protein